MRNFLKTCSLVVLFAPTFALFPPTLHAQWLYVNNNNAIANTNTVTGFNNTVHTTLLPFIPGSPWPTMGTGLGTALALQNQALYTLGIPPGSACLFISDPAPGSGFPAGDIAAFSVNTATGMLTLTNRYASPGANSGNLYGIALTTGNATLYAGYTASNTIGVWSITWNGAQCQLTFSAQIAAVGLHGGFIDGMREAPNFKALVVAYTDGSIESFMTAGFGIAAAPCPTPIDSTGFIDGNDGTPAGVDITKDSKYAIFGDSSNGVTELETAKLPITCNTLTKDFGGSIVASGSNLGPGVNSNNVWLSPNEQFIYVANNHSRTVTTVAYAEVPNTMALATGCTAGYTNPTKLKNPTHKLVADAGIQTSVTSGNGTRLYVAEVDIPPSVALLRVQSVGCTREVPLSPFTDSSSNFGLFSLSAWPPRLF